MVSPPPGLPNCELLSIPLNGALAETIAGTAAFPILRGQDTNCSLLFPRSYRALTLGQPGNEFRAEWLWFRVLRVICRRRKR